MKITIGQTYSFRQLGKRENQEDSRYPDSDKPNNGQRFFVVCDGVGGNVKGEVASETVCNYIGLALKSKNLSDIYFDNEMFSKILDGAYDALDNVSDKNNRGMATTMTFLCLHKGGCTMAHIGDSRIYHIRPKKGIIYRSEDHSLVNSMVHSGIITPEEAINHPQSNVITRCMEVVEEDQNRSMATLTLTTDIQKGDYFFMCSDGVLSCVSDEGLIKILSLEVDDEQKIEMIAKKSADSSDNNTAILIPILDVDELDDIIIYDKPLEESNTTLRFGNTQQFSMEISSMQKVKKSNNLIEKFKRMFSK